MSPAETELAEALRQGVEDDALRRRTVAAMGPLEAPSASLESRVMEAARCWLDQSAAPTGQSPEGPSPDIPDAETEAPDNSSPSSAPSRPKPVSRPQWLHQAAPEPSETE